MMLAEGEELEANILCLKPSFLEEKTQFAQTGDAAGEVQRA